MTWRSVSVLAGVVGVVLSPGVLQGQKGIEGGVHAMATFADYNFGRLGAHLNLRPGGRTRFTLSASPGIIEEEFTFRGESTAQFMLNPSSRRAGFYAGGGIAGVVGAIDQGYLLLVLGLESRPGGSSGWVLEGGIGGGVRILVGYRWRRLKR